MIAIATIPKPKIATSTVDLAGTFRCFAENEKAGIPGPSLSSWDLHRALVAYFSHVTYLKYLARRGCRFVRRWPCARCIASRR